MTWLEDHQKELALLNKLGRKEASGLATEEEKCRLQTLQMEFGFRTNILCQGVSLTKLEHELDAIDAVRKRVETFLGGEG